MSQTPWRPEGHDDGVLNGSTRRALTDPETGELILQNMSNAFFGTAVAWAVLVFAALLFNVTTTRGGSSEVT